MTISPRPYQDDFRKNSKSSNAFKQPKNMVRSNVIDGERKERLKRWITFFRRNPHRLISDYFGIKLFTYQVLMIWVLQRSNLAYIVASRAAAKTWIISVWALTLAVLYPGIQIVVCAKTLKQGGILLSEKLTSLQKTYPNVAREIEHVTTNANTYEAIFHCGSSIKVVPSSESARGNRANYIVVEESRLVPKEILESIIKPFLFSRMPPYRLKTEYANDNLLKEEGLISYITSAWYSAEYWYTYVKSCIRRMAKGDETANFLAFDYFISLYHNIKTEEMIKNEMSDIDSVTAQMEYFNLPSGSSGKSYYKSTMFPRTIKKAFYPQREETYNSKKNPYEIKKVEGEIRLVSVDVATRANRNNDQTIISCIRLIPLIGRGYARQLVYQESHKGRDTISQAKRIKEIFFDFTIDGESSFIVLDMQNIGISIYDSLGQITAYGERGIDLPAMTVVDIQDFTEEKVMDELRIRTLGLGALPVIFPISASQSLNSQIAVAFRTSLQKKLWNFLIVDGDAEEFLMRTNKEFMVDPNDSESFAFFLSPYVHTGLLIGECINLDMSLVNGMIKLVEKAGCYKDRYSSISYGNWVASYFDKILLKQVEDKDDWSEFLNSTLVGSGFR